MHTQVIFRVDRKTASCAFYVSTRQAFGQKLPISLPRRRIIGLLLYSGCQCGKARQGGSGGGRVFAPGTATTSKDILAREPLGCLRGQRPLY